MTYDDLSLSELRGYFKAKEPGKRARAEAWATAIGLQDLANLKKTGRFRRVGPDKGGHWEVE